MRFPPRRWTRRRRRASSFRNASSEGDAIHVVLRGRYARARGGGGRRRCARRAMRKRTPAFPSRFVSRAVVARSETTVFGKSQTAIFFGASRMGNHPHDPPEPRRTETPVRDSSARSRNRSLRARLPRARPRVFATSAPRSHSRVAHATRRSGARAHAASTPSTALPARKARAEPGRDARAGSRARRARARTSFGRLVHPREASRGRAWGRSRRDASDGGFHERHERLPRLCPPPR